MRQIAKTMSVNHSRHERTVFNCRFVLMLLAVFVGSLTICPVVGAQDDVEVVREVLSKRRYPWYDASEDRVRSFNFPQTKDAKSTDRNVIPLRDPRVNKNNTVRTTGNGWFGLSYLAWFAVVALIAAVAGLLVWAFFRLESQSRKRLDSAPKRSLAESIEHLPFQVEEKSGDFRQLAHNAYAAGDFRRAITYLFSHVLVTLDQQGLIRLRKGKTNRQYLNELKTYRGLANFYQQVMVPFESTFFGDHELSKSDFESCWTQLDGFQSGVNQTSQVTS